jgi:Tfp pilus assembly protein PilE
MEILISIAQYLFIIVCIVAVLSGIAWTSEIYLNYKRDKEIKEAQLRSLDFANYMRGVSYWFSEDDASMKLLQYIADDICEGYSLNFNPRKVRDRWQKLIEKENNESTCGRKSVL